MKTNIHLW